MNKRKIEQGTRYILEGLIGKPWSSDPNYEDTPQRVARFYEEMFRPRGYNVATFDDQLQYDQMIMLRHHKEWTLCPHHLLPVALDVSLAYLPRVVGGERQVEEGTLVMLKKDRTPLPTTPVLGVSKLVRLIQNYLSEPVLQEALTHMLADELIRRVSPEGCGVHIIGEHMCMRIRGVKSEGSIATLAFRGSFKEDPSLRQIFMGLL